MIELLFLLIIVAVLLLLGLAQLFWFLWIKVTGKDVRKEDYFHFRQQLDKLTIIEARNMFDKLVQNSSKFEIVISDDGFDDSIRLPNSIVQLFSIYESISHMDVSISRQQLCVSRLDNSVIIGTDGESPITVRGTDDSVFVSSPMLDQMSASDVFPSIYHYLLSLKFEEWYKTSAIGSG